MCDNGHGLDGQMVVRGRYRQWRAAVRAAAVPWLTRRAGTSKAGQTDGQADSPNQAKIARARFWLVIFKIGMKSAFFSKIELESKSPFCITEPTIFFTDRR